jgi:hypothetical protein
MYLSSFYFCQTNIKGGIFMSRTNNEVINILFGIAGLVGIGYAIGTHTKLAKISERLDRGIDELANDTEIDIPEELVDKAIDKAVQVEVKRAVEKAANDTVVAMKKDIHSQVKSVIDDEYDNLKDSVLKEITNEAAKIDASRVRRSVEEAAKKAALEKFDDNLDDILEKFNDNLDNTSRIYSSIRDTLTKNADSNKGFTVRLG